MAEARLAVDRSRHAADFRFLRISLFRYSPFVLYHRSRQLPILWRPT